MSKACRLQALGTSVAVPSVCTVVKLTPYKKAASLRAAALDKYINGQLITIFIGLDDLFGHTLPGIFDVKRRCFGKAA